MISSMSASMASRCADRVGEGAARRAAALAHAALAREDAVVELVARALVGEAPVAAQGVAQLVDGLGDVVHAHDARRAAVAEGIVRPCSSMSFSWSRRFSKHTVQDAPRPTGRDSTQRV